MIHSTSGRDRDYKKSHGPPLRALGEDSACFPFILHLSRHWLLRVPSARLPDQSLCRSWGASKIRRNLLRVPAFQGRRGRLCPPTLRRQPERKGWKLTISARLRQPILSTVGPLKRGRPPSALLPPKNFLCLSLSRFCLLQPLVFWIGVAPCSPGARRYLPLLVLRTAPTLSLLTYLFTAANHSSD